MEPAPLSPNNDSHLGCENRSDFLSPLFALSALAVLLVAPLLCDGEPNPSRGGRGGGGRGEYAFLAS